MKKNLYLICIATLLLFGCKLNIPVSLKFGNILIKPYTAMSLADLHKEGKLDGELKEIASKLDENNNPVLLLAKL